MIRIRYPRQKGHYRTLCQPNIRYDYNAARIWMSGTRSPDRALLSIRSTSS